MDQEIEFLLRLLRSTETLKRCQLGEQDERVNWALHETARGRLARLGINVSAGEGHA